MEDWKGHKIDHFGDLLLYGSYTVLKGEGAKEVEREVSTRFAFLYSRSCGWVHFCPNLHCFPQLTARLSLRSTLYCFEVVSRTLQKKSDGGRTSSFKMICQESEYSCPSKGGAGSLFLSSITPSCPASKSPGSHSQQCRIPCLRYFHPSCCLQSLANGTSPGY